MNIIAFLFVNEKNIEVSPLFFVMKKVCIWQRDIICTYFEIFKFSKIPFFSLDFTTLPVLRFVKTFLIGLVKNAISFCRKFSSWNWECVTYNASLQNPNPIFGAKIWIFAKIFAISAIQCFHFVSFEEVHNYLSIRLK